VPSSDLSPTAGNEQGTCSRTSPILLSLPTFAASFSPEVWVMIGKETMGAPINRLLSAFPLIAHLTYLGSQWCIVLLFHSFDECLEIVAM
jgi:hypothetical protein